MFTELAPRNGAKVGRCAGQAMAQPGLPPKQALVLGERGSVLWMAELETKGIRRWRLDTQS